MAEHFRGYGYPAAKQLDIPYKDPPPLKNPDLSGITLSIAAYIVTSSSSIAKFFYSNAQFSQQLEAVKECEDCIPTYSPNIIPTAALHDANSESPPSATELSQYRAIEPANGKRFYSIRDFHDAFKSGATTPTAVAEALLPLIRRDVPNPTKHAAAFIAVKPEQVLASAAASTERWRAGKPLGILDGVPIAMKDDILLKGFPTTLGASFNVFPEAEESSWCIQKLIDTGAVMLGKCNMHEMGMGTTNNNPGQGTPLNPYNEKYYTGGSTGGGAHAVAAGLVPFVQGSDAGGSIRVPANYCGLYGLKPTHNRVSTSPAVNDVASTCVIGPVAANMADLEVAFRVMAQRDSSNSLSSLFKAPRRAAESRPKVLGVFKEWVDLADPPVKERFQKAIDYLQNKKGYQVVPIALPHVHEAQLAHAMTVLLEGLSKHGKHISKLEASNQLVWTVMKHASAGDFLAAQKVRTLILQHLAYLFEENPGLIIVTPTTPNAGWPVRPGDLSRGFSDGNFTVRNMTYIWLANFCGLPSLQFPVGYAEPLKGQGDSPVPVGLIGNGEWGTDDELIEFGFDGEDFLREDGGGRRMPPESNWVDVLGMVLNGGKAAKTNNAEVNGK